MDPVSRDEVTQAQDVRELEKATVEVLMATHAAMRLQAEGSDAPLMALLINADTKPEEVRQFACNLSWMCGCGEAVVCCQAENVVTLMRSIALDTNACGLIVVFSAEQLTRDQQGEILMRRSLNTLHRCRFIFVVTEDPGFLVPDRWDLGFRKQVIRTVRWPSDKDLLSKGAAKIVRQEGAINVIPIRRKSRPSLPTPPRALSPSNTPSSSPPSP